MKQIFKRPMFFALVVILGVLSCRKSDLPNEALKATKDKPGHLKQTNTYSSEVAIRWMDMQVKQIRAYPGIIGNVAYARHYAYCGIALYESVVEGMPAWQSIAPQLNGLQGLPETKPGYAYHWAASANAALAYMNRKMFPSATTANKTAMDELEASLLESFQDDADPATLERSVAYGRAVAEAVYNWSETDGYKDVNLPYTPPMGMVGGVYWTPPATANVNTLPYMGKVRRLVANSGKDANLGAPDYSQLGAMTLDVIASKPAVGTDNYNKAFWWRDFPGTSTPGHYVSILRQVLTKEQPTLDVAAYAYALGGITVMDLTITTWQDKFKYLLARPFNYNSVIGVPFTAWLGAPHPEYPAAHASLSMANAEAMTRVFGDNYAFTDSTFFGLVTPQSITLQPRHYQSFREAGEEAGMSRLYGGIHYRSSIDAGFWQGRKVASNVQEELQFRK